MAERKALITGITGQDGSYLAEFLLDQGYDVFGVVRRSSTENFERIRHIRDRITLVSGDLHDQSSLVSAVSDSHPSEVYNLGAQSFVPASWEQPVLTQEVTGVGVTRMLEAIRQVDPKIKFYQASSSEMFGKVRETPQNEDTPFYPRSPYGFSKMTGHWATVNYRESYGMYTTSGILFNHESERRGFEFVTRKITHAAARIKLGLANEVRLGDLDPQRDWGYAPDYVRAMWLMLQQDIAEDFVIATGTTRTVREFGKVAFDTLGLDFDEFYVRDPKFVRPAEVDVLVGDPSKANKVLRWKAETPFEEWVGRMVEADLKIIKNNR